MPAAQPIRINYGDPVLLSQLAAGAGAAQARRRTSEQAYRLQLQQMASDASVNRAAVAANARRPDRPRFGQLPQTSPSMLSDASGYSRPETFTNPGPQNAIQRFAMERQQQNGGPGFMPSREIEQRAGGINPSVKARTGPISMVPATGTLSSGNRSPSTITERDTGRTFTRFNEGTTVISGAGAAPGEAQQLREQDPRFAQSQQQMVTPQVRQQMDVVRAMEGALPPQQYEALLKAAESGQMKMGNMVDDLRQALPNQTSTRLTAVDRQDEKIQADLQFADYYDAQDAASKTNFMQTQLRWEPTPPTSVEMSSPERRLAYEAKVEAEGEAAYNDWSMARRSMGSSTTLPLTGTKPQSSGAVVDITSEAEADALPVGTRIRLPDGRMGVTE